MSQQNTVEQFERLLEMAVRGGDPRMLAMLKQAGAEVGTSSRPAEEEAAERSLRPFVEDFVAQVASTLPDGRAYHGRFVLDTLAGEPEVTSVAFTEIGKRDSVYVARGTEDAPLPDGIEDGATYRNRVEAIHAAGLRVQSTVPSRESEWLVEDKV